MFGADGVSISVVMAAAVARLRMLVVATDQLAMTVSDATPCILHVISTDFGRIVRHPEEPILDSVSPNSTLDPQSAVLRLETFMKSIWTMPTSQ